MIKEKTLFEERMLNKQTPESEEYIVVRVVERNSNFMIDIRSWIESDSYSGYTKKGIRFNVENYQSFIDIIDRLDEFVENEIL